MMFRHSFLLLALVILFPKTAKAIYRPDSISNNKYGIHIADVNDLQDIPMLVNSSGGDWGYVTFVIADNDRDVGKWQLIFRKLRRTHLIPLVRLATHVENRMWVAPNELDIHEWVSFFSQLPWPTKNRYVILFNEPNHAKEWGGRIAPEQYASLAVTFAKKLKSSSDDYFILPAGFDASAQNTSESMDEELYLSWILATKPDFFVYIDGWTSHSYPNPDFSGSPHARGRGTIATYEWELSLLKKLGVNKSLSVFITETGWAHRGFTDRSALIAPDDVAQNVQIAAASVWNDPRIVAITPFLFQYEEPLFAMFSWLVSKNRQPYPFYIAYQRLPKAKGDPLLPPSEEYVSLLSRQLHF